MTALTRWVLSHKRLVTGVWVVITIAAFASIQPSSDALSQEFTVPGREGFETNREIVARYGSGGDVAPLVPVVTLPAGTTFDSPGVRAQFDAAVDRVRAAVPGSRALADEAFVSKDRRTAYALVYIPEKPGLEPGQAEAKQAEAALAGATVAGAPVRVTGLDALRADSASGAGDDTSVSILVEVLVAGLGALIVLAFVFGSFMAVVPLADGGGRRPDDVPARVAAHGRHRRQRGDPVPGRAGRPRHRDRLRAAGGDALARGARGAATKR